MDLRFLYACMIWLMFIKYLPGLQFHSAKKFCRCLVQLWRQGDNCSYPMGPYMPSAPPTPRKKTTCKRNGPWLILLASHSFADQTIIFPYGSVSKWRFTLILSHSQSFPPCGCRTSWMVVFNKIHCSSVAVGTRLTRPYSYHLTPVLGWCCVIVNLMQQRSWRHQRSCVHCSAGSILWEFCHQAERWKLKRMPLVMGCFFLVYFWPFLEVTGKSICFWLFLIYVALMIGSIVL